MNPIGLVTVAATTVVKAVSAIGIVVGGLDIASAALKFMILGLQPEFAAQAAVGAIPFLIGVAGWKFADHVNGKMHVSQNKAAQEAELARLQAYHGQAL
ncbi:MAG: hypothetical protein MRY32_06910 [Rickettsiales bacterium]|nr:hypothetical protein [Rickettsiales bacterium]